VSLAAPGSVGDRRDVVDAEVDRVVKLGGTEVRRVAERGEYWVVMQDPEGNEFCLQ
jgi:predicted enzyme related to lactoylglutathione lyase